MHINSYAQVDSAVQVTVTPFLHLLLNYEAFSDSCPCPIYLVAALDTNSKALPLGVDYIQIPSEDDIGQTSYIDVRC